MLPQLDKALFIDSDTYIESGIDELYDLDLEQYVCASSYNMPIYKEMLEEANLNDNNGYFNAGVFLVNLKKWRELDIQKRILDYYYQNGGNFPTDDQSVMNAILSKYNLVVDYKFNAMIGTFYWSYKKFCKLNTKIAYKTKAEFMNARENPVIVHFNGPGIRPWEKWCAHPYTKKYRALLKTFYPDYKLIQSKKTIILIMQYFKHKIIDNVEKIVNW